MRAKLVGLWTLAAACAAGYAYLEGQPAVYLLVAVLVVGAMYVAFTKLE